MTDNNSAAQESVFSSKLRTLTAEEISEVAGAGAVKAASKDRSSNDNHNKNFS